ncbi:MAG: hypothetical protein KAI71_03960 [Candidatus Pacebacteria bacterium]|nr:hypothetical protein [Candidatus Paceibacterota bacterium]
MKKYTFIFREGRLDAFFVDLLLRNYGIDDFVFIEDKHSLEGYASLGEMKKASEIGFDLCLNRNKIKQLEERFKKNYLTYLNFLNYLDKTNLEDLDNNEIKIVLEKFCAISRINVDIYFLTESHYFEKLEKRIKGFLLKKSNDPSELNKYFIHLTTPANIYNFVHREELEWVELIKKNKIRNINNNVEKEIYDHFEKFRFMFFNKKPNHLIQKFKRMLPLHEIKLDKTKRKILHSDKMIRDNRNKTIEDLKPTKEILILCESVRRTAILRLNLRFFMNSKFFGKKISRAIAKRNFLGVNQVENCLMSEIYSLLNNRKIDLTEVNKRNDGFVAVKKGKKLVFYTGERSQKIIKKVKPIVDYNISSLSGSIANTGKITGKVRVIKNASDKEELDIKISEMKKGDILVTEMTRPNLISTCKKASAIITDEGGINCHASIISRELNIPCIIGTKIATEILHDGALVEIDGGIGLIKIINNNTKK